ncbi:MAG: hypothetical protein IT470_02625 [Pseudomonadales bacterium]|nr:hypothetical protein [Pseudomonadales bacterium]
MNIRHLLLAATLLGVACNGALAASKKTAAAKPEPAPISQPAATEDLTKKITDMQQAIEKLRTDLASIQKSRDELQVKLDQSDKDVAAQMSKIETLKKQIAEKQKEAEALAAQKKP